MFNESDTKIKKKCNHCKKATNQVFRVTTFVSQKKESHMGLNDRISILEKTIPLNSLLISTTLELALFFIICDMANAPVLIIFY